MSINLESVVVWLEKWNGVKYPGTKPTVCIFMQMVICEQLALFRKYKNNSLNKLKT